MGRTLAAWWSHPPAERGDRPVVVALHGRGATEASLAVIAEALPGTVLACPRGPVPEGLGAAWWQMHAIGYPVAASLARTRDLLLRWLDDEVGAAPVALLGFSDGATTAADLLLAQPCRFAAAALLGGALPWSTGAALEPGRLGGVPVLLSYGDGDGVIPADLLARSARWLLEQSGAQAEVVVEPGLEHYVSTAQVQRAEALFTRSWPVRALRS